MKINLLDRFLYSKYREILLEFFFLSEFCWKKQHWFLVLASKKVMVEFAIFLLFYSFTFFFLRLFECWSKSRTLDNFVSCMAARERKNWKNRWQSGESYFGLLPLQPTTYTQRASTFNKRS